jgi:ADP-ribose pyrophosphatase YjhB (NUDIX family)
MQRLALVVVETDAGLVFIHPPGGPVGAPASLPSGIVLDDETPEQGAVRLVREQTGLAVPPGHGGITQPFTTLASPALDVSPPEN